jgi:hypothetical protein
LTGIMVRGGWRMGAVMSDRQTAVIQAMFLIAKHLTPWEVEFCASLDIQNQRGIAFSPKQWAVLDKLLAKYEPGILRARASPVPDRTALH